MKKKIYFGFLIPIFLIFGFLSKQVPLYFFIYINSYNNLFIYLKQNSTINKYFTWNTFIFVLIFIFFFGNVDFESFIQLYIIYPQSKNQGLKGKPTFDGLCHFKFIYISIAPFCIYKYKAYNL